MQYLPEGADDYRLFRCNEARHGPVSDIFSTVTYITTPLMPNPAVELIEYLT